MNDKAKSFLYFTALVISLVMYYNVESDQSAENSQLANNTIEHVSTPEALN